MKNILSLKDEKININEDLLYVYIIRFSFLVRGIYEKNKCIICLPWEYL